MFRKKKGPELSREQSLAAVVVANAEVEATRDEHGIVTLEMPLAIAPLLQRAARFLGGRPARHKVSLDEVGSFVWEMCDGRTPVRDMIGRLAEQYKLNRKEAEVSLTTFVRTLGRKGLVVIVVPEKPR